jgi:hypothetical protein
VTGVFSNKGTDMTTNDSLPNDQQQQESDNLAAREQGEKDAPGLIAMIWALMTGQQ